MTNIDSLHGVLPVLQLPYHADESIDWETLVNGGLSGQIFKRNPGLAETSRQSVPVRELITCEEVARALVFLADPANRNLTGSTLTLDGGLSLISK